MGLLSNFAQAFGLMPPPAAVPGLNLHPWSAGDMGTGAGLGGPPVGDSAIMPAPPPPMPIVPVATAAQAPAGVHFAAAAPAPMADMSHPDAPAGLQFAQGYGGVPSHLTDVNPTTPQQPSMQDLIRHALALTGGQQQGGF